MSTAARLLGALGVLSGIALCGAVTWVYFRFGEDRSFYKSILGRYNSGFFVEYEQARRQNAIWLKDDREVALRYIVGVDYCPTRTVTGWPADSGKAIWIITDVCTSGMFTVKKRRVDLAWRDGVWRVEWAGLRYKCADDPAGLGQQLLTHNPLRQSRLPALAPVNEALRSMAPSLNAWHLECP